MKKSILSLLVTAIIVTLCGTSYSQQAPKKLAFKKNNVPTNVKVIVSQSTPKPAKNQLLNDPNSKPAPASKTSILSGAGLNPAVKYDQDGDVISLNGWKITFQKPNNPLGSQACGTAYPVVQVPSNAKTGTCPLDVACDDPANRDANIPGGADPIKFMQLRWTVILDGGGSPTSNINMSRVNALMTELNNDFMPWRIQFCLDTAIFVSSAQYYEFDGASEESGMKSTHGANYINVINIYVVNNLTNPNAGGYAYFPYSGYGGTNFRGGVVMSRSSSSVGAHTLAHEVGHTFGLHHTFHGVDEVNVCGPCYEAVGAADGSPASGDDHGDKCSDTNPHETNSFSCNSSPGGSNGCDAFNWDNVPVNNHMSYSFCSSQFTSQQAGRMHCMINTYVPGWVTNGGVTCGSLPPVADFDASPIIWPQPSNVNFTNLTAGKATVTTWSWDFDVQGVGGVTPTTSTAENPPTVIYANTGLFEVRLIATNPNGTDSIVKTDYIEVVGPIGDCDTLDFQWITPVSSAVYYTGGPGDHLTGIPCPTINTSTTDSIGLYERFPTPTAGSSTIGGVRLGLGWLFDPNDNTTVNIVVYDDDGAGNPDLASGPLGGVFGLSPTTDLLAPPPGFLSERWHTIMPEIVLPSTSFHVGIEIFPGDASDSLVLFSSINGEGEGDSSNHVLGTAFGLEDWQLDWGLDFDLDIIPMMGELAPDPVITSFGQITACDTTQVFFFDTVLLSTHNSWQITFADGTTWTDTVNPGTLVRTYFGPGPDTITLSASNTCGKVGTNSYIIPYAFNVTPVADFTKDLSNPICLPPSVPNCATFTASPSGAAMYTWDFGDGTTYTDTSDVISYCYSGVGSYYVEVEVTAYGSIPTDTIFYEDFDVSMGGFATFDVDGEAPIAGLNPPFDGTDGTAWVGNSAEYPGRAVSTSYYVPSGTSDDWMISPAILLNANSSLYWEARASDPTYPDGYEVRISTTTQTVAGCLANAALFSIAAENAYATPRELDLAVAGYANQTVYIAFRNISNDMFLLNIDDVLVGSTGLGCSNSLQRTDYIDIVDCSITLPTAAMNTSSPSSGCDSVTVTFTDNSTGSPTSWVWDFNDGNFTTAQNPGAHTFIGAGTYNIMLIASNGGGTDTAFFTVDVYDTPAIPTAGTDAAYCENDVLTDLTATGTGVEWFSDMALSNSLGTGSPLTPTVSVGTNVYYVTDTENGCQSSADSVVLTVTQAATAAAGTDDAICAGSDYKLSGSIGGTATTSLWTTSGSGTFDDATLDTALYTPSTADTIAGMVTLKITSNDPDAGGPCVSIADSMVLTINPKPSVTISSSTNILCTGDATGDATATVTGGSGGGYVYVWSDPLFQTNSTATGLLAGSVGVMVTDGNGCIDTVTTVLTEPSTALSGITGTIDASCGVADGVAFVTASGGTGAYTYQWDDPSSQITDTATALLAGPYNVMITDSNSCLVIVAASVSDAGAPTVTVSNIVGVSCFGAADGSAQVSATGGAGPYTYTWTSGGNTTSETGISGGSHSVTVEDSIGCASVVAFTIDEPAALVISSEIDTSISCNGMANGSITVVATGGTGTISYSVDSGATYPNTTGVFTGLSGGTYNVFVRDSSLCATAGSVIIITEPSAIVISAETPTNASCNGLTDGAIMVTATGGTGTLNYSVDSGATYANTTGMFTGLMAATYGVSVQDSNGCTTTGSMLTITEPTVVTISADTSTNVLCNGGTDGTITIVASGGTGTLSYSIDGGTTYPNSTGLFTGLTAGSYNVAVQDSNGCMVTGSALSITEPGAMTSNTNAVSTNCGQADGQASVAVFGGTAPFAYLWDDTGNSTTDTIMNLAVGTYNVTVTDASGCTSTSSATISDQGGGTSNTSVIQNASCNGDCDGSGSVSVTGGQTPFVYLWDDLAAQTTQTAAGLCVGTYVVVVTDGNGCTLTDSISITEPVSLTSTVSSTPAQSGSCDGTATATGTGGTSPYNYLWNDPGAQTSGTATGLCPVSVSVTITDANGCTATATDSIGTFIGIFESVEVVTVDIYPNPNQGTFSIAYDFGLTVDAKIIVFNKIGSRVVDHDLGSTASGIHTIDMNDHANGIYYVQLITDQGTIIKKISLIR